MEPRPKPGWIVASHPPRDPTIARSRWLAQSDARIVPDLGATPSDLTSPSIVLRALGLWAVFYFDFSIALSTSFAPSAYSFSSSGASLQRSRRNCPA